MEKSHPFVVVEGQNKSGKGVIVDYLRGRISDEYMPAMTIREPGGTAVGEDIRSILLSDVERPAVTNLLLFNAARAATIQRINQELESKAVIADRSYLSTLAFQMHGEGVDEDLARAICDAALSEGYNPDAFLVLDIPFETYLERKENLTQEENDYFEKNRDFFERVREGYLIEAKIIGATVIDASQELEIVKNNVWEIVEEVL